MLEELNETFHYNWETDEILELADLSDAGHWVTINGRHILIRTQGVPLGAVASAKRAVSTLTPELAQHIKEIQVNARSGIQRIPILGHNFIKPVEYESATGKLTITPKTGKSRVSRNIPTMVHQVLTQHHSQSSVKKDLEYELNLSDGYNSLCMIHVKSDGQGGHIIEFLAPDGGEDDETDETESASMIKSYDPKKARSDATLGDWVEITHARPPRMFRQNVEKYLGKSFKEIKVMKQGNPPYRSNLVRFAIHNVFSADQIEKEANYESWGNEEPVPVERVMVDTGSGTFEGLANGYLFLSLKDNVKVVLAMFQGFEGSSSIEIYAVDKGISASILKSLNDYIKENNYLKGKKLLSNGTFLNVAKTTWEEVILSEQMKHTLQTYILGYMANIEELRKLGLPTKRGLLIIGPPGNGKTMIGKALAWNSQSTFIWVPASSNYSQVYLMARELAPTIVFIEDIATHGGLDRRAGPVDSHTAELLNMLDGVEANDCVLTVATENNFDLLDPALRNRPGRFDIIVPLPNPDVDLREKILQHYLPQVSKDIIEYAANQTVGYSGAHLRELATRIVLENATLETVQEVIDGISTTFGVLNAFADSQKELNEAGVAGLYGERQIDRGPRHKKKKPPTTAINSPSSPPAVSINIGSDAANLSLSDDLEKGITPKIIDLAKKPLIDNEMVLSSQIDFKDGFVIINLLDENEKIVACYKCQYGEQEPTDFSLGLLEALSAARFATEVPVHVEHLNFYPVPLNFGELLSDYGLATVKFIGETYEVLSKQDPKENTLLFSGGADSTHLLFNRLEGDTNAVTFYHGQAPFHIGAWPEKKAVSVLLEMARDGFDKPIPHKFLKARWNCNHSREWAKAYRNFLSIVQASIAFPNTRIWIGTNIQDQLHDCHPGFINEFAVLTGIPIEVPSVNTGRRELMEDLIDLTLSSFPYMYASTASCQFVRFMKSKHLFCGSCHSCLLRLPGIEFGADPRFENFNKDLKIIPKELESKISVSKYYMRRPSQSILKKFFADFEGASFEDFLPALQFLSKEWEQDYDITKFLSKGQLQIYKERLEA